MGIRGVDIQVAIQTATEANKLAQADTAYGRAGEASSREEAEKARAQQQKESQQAEKADQALIKSREEKEGRDETESDADESEIATGLDEVEINAVNTTEENRNKVERSGPLHKKGHLDILA